MKWKFYLVVAILWVSSTRKIQAQDTNDGSSRFRLTITNCDEACVEALRNAIERVSQEQNLTASFSDYNECAFSDRGNCSDFAQCLNFAGSYSCSCSSGFDDLDPSNPGTVCFDINECEDPALNDCLSPEENARCDNTNGSYVCVCESGYTGEGNVTCEDIDECQSGVHDCFSDASCANTIGSFMCTCPSGFTGNGTYCENIDECEADSPCVLEANTDCVDMEGSFECVCKSGFTVQNGVCTDVDECNANMSMCGANQMCENTQGSFVCRCMAGYQASPFPNMCFDINECAFGLDSCMGDFVCSNTIGSYECVCPDGVDCGNTTNMCNGTTPNMCDQNADCEDVVGGYRCTCRSGFIGSGERCADVDECDSNSGFVNDCDSNAMCINTDGSFTCLCMSSFTGDGRLCIDINECENVTTNNCHPNSTCFNRLSSFDCVCDDGFIGDGVNNCTEIDECSSAPCMNNGTCIDRINNYTCVCPADFTGTDCETEIDNCMNHFCQNEATCIDGFGNFTCMCALGYSGQLCEIDIDECAASPCVNASTCIDGINNYTCVCDVGFTGSICDINVDDCENVTCNNGSCVDGISSFTCVCDPGYAGEFCEEEFDECSLSPCVNSPIIGGCIDGLNNYTCVCLPGFTGSDCEINIDDCVNVTCNNGVCVDGIMNYSCSCNPGFTGSICDAVIVNCTQDPCLNEGNCTDGADNFTCSCAPGYTGKFCEINIDDCVNVTCVNGSCVDGVNNFVCDCYPGYTGQLCEQEINECELSPCENSGTCIDLFNNYTCLCAQGFSGQNCEIRTQNVTFQLTFNATFDSSLNNVSSSLYMQFEDAFINTITAIGNEIGFTVIGTQNLVFSQGSVIATGDVTVTSSIEFSMLQQMVQELIDAGTLSEVLQIYNVTVVTVRTTTVCKCLPPPPMHLPPPPPPNDFIFVSPPPPPIMPPPPPPEDFVGAGQRPPPPPIMPPPPPPDDIIEGTRVPPPPIMPPPPPPPEEEIIQRIPPPPMMPPPPPPPEEETTQRIPPPPMMPPPPPPPEGEVTQRIPPPPMMPPPPPPPEEEVAQRIPPPPMMPPPPPPPEEEVAQRIPPPPMMPPPPPPPFDSISSRPPPPPMMPPPPPPQDTDAIQRPPPPPMMPPPPPPVDIVTEKPPPPPMMPPPPPLYEYPDEECPQGYIRNLSDCTCVLITSCVDLADVCGNGTCVDGNDTYICECEDDFEFDNGTCLDVNECLDTEACNTTTEVCVNRLGGFECICANGYNETDNGCEDINECLRSETCDFETEMCSNLPGSFVCNCASGFTGLSGNCTDINECEIYTSLCGLNEECVNTRGSYTCQCLPGFNPTESGCIDRDECASEELNNCHPNATCTNEVGSFTCSCDCGYSDYDETSAPGTDCVFDYCKYTEHRCDHSCVLSRDSFECVCDEGFYMEENMCLPNRSCFANCIDGVCYLDNSNAAQCRCNNGFVPSATHGSSICVASSACVEDNLCQDTCQFDGEASFCSCGPGRAPAPHAPDFCCEAAVSVCDGTQCSRNGNCSDDFTRVQRYTCVCDGGWIGSECDIDVNECLTGIVEITGPELNIEIVRACRNGGVCNNLDGTFECLCPSGYAGDRCQDDVNECEGVNDCSPNATCTNVVGGYICTCDDGFIEPFDGPNNGSVCQESTLLPFGPSFGESVLSGSDTFSPLFNSEVGFTVGSNRYYRFYVTTNGAIILQSTASSTRRRIYRNPPFLQLTSDALRNDEAALLPYWAALDVRRFGEISYGFYRTSNYNENARMVLDFASESIRDIYINDPNLSNFNATEVFKVTYDNIPYYPFRYVLATRGRVGLTFQTLLITDGIRTFSLTTYTNMDSPFPFSTGTWVGYITSSDDTFTHPVSQSNLRLRPDLYFDSITNRTGVIVMRTDPIDTASTPESRCQAWYDSEPYFFEWLLYNEPCPYTPAHVATDYRFTSVPFYGGFLDSIVDESILNASRLWTGPNCVQSSFNFFGLSFGPTCCYGSRGEFLFGGDMFSGAHDSRNLIYFDTEQEAVAHYESDVQPGLDCCRDSNNPYFCQLYSEKRPATNTFGYQPLFFGACYTDPHLITIDGVEYSSSGLGEYILLQTNNGSGITAQVRMTRNTGSNGELLNSTVVTAIAVTNQVASPRTVVQIEVGSENDSDILNMRVYINQARISNVQLSSLQNQRPVVLLSGNLPGLTLLSETNQLRVVDVNTRGSFAIQLNNNRSLTIIAQLTSGTYDGLDGVFDGNETNDFRLRNGTTLDLASLRFQLITGPDLTVAEQRWNTYLSSNWILSSRVEPFVESWRISMQESLFVYPENTSYATFNDPSFQGANLQDLLASATTEFLDQAAAVCISQATNSTNPQCLHDVLVSGDLSRGQADFELPQGVGNTPPVFNLSPDLPTVMSGVLTIYATLGETVTVQLNVTDPENDTFTFSLDRLLANDPDAMIDTDGLFTWTPMSSNVASVSFIATDSGNLSSSLQAAIVFCSCQNNGTCGSEVGPYQSIDVSNSFYLRTCACTSAFTGLSCQDNFDACSEDPCSFRSNCTDLAAPSTGFTCSGCPDGFIGDGITCTPNVCETLNCSQNCSGIEETNFAVCLCFDGYTLNPDNVTCDDINECEITSTLCVSQGATCRNTEGSFMCECDEGQMMNDEGQCIAIDECANNTDLCDDATTTCVNQLVGYSCQCQEGFEPIPGNDTSCRDIDECLSDTTCSPITEQCNNTIGSFRCDCLTGYESDASGACVNIEVCSRFPNLCPEGPIGGCQDLTGAPLYRCTCIEGYVYNNMTNTCDDVNECMTSSPCSHGCNNTEGSFRCSCPVGLMLDSSNVNCSDINECNDPTSCQQQCINTEGNFTCACFDGFNLTNGICVANQNCTAEQAQSCVNADCYVNQTSNQPICACRNGYERVNATVCQDIDECAAGVVNNCDVNANCTNIMGSFSCECPTYYADFSASGTLGRDCRLLVSPVISRVPVTDIGLNSITVRWGLVSLGDAIRVYITQTGNDNRLEQRNLSTSDLTYTFNGLMTNTNYTIYVETVLGTASSRPEVTQVATRPDLLPPTFNVIDTVTDVTSSSIRVTWTPPMSDYEIESYRITLASSVAQQTLTFNGSVTETTFSSLDATTLYNISIATTFGVNISNFETIEQFTGPNPPTNITASSASTYGSINLRWEAPLVGLVTNYDVTFTPPDMVVYLPERTGRPFGIAENLVPGTNYTITIASVFMNITSDSVQTSGLFVPVTTTPAPTTITTTEPTTSPPIECPRFFAAINGVCTGTQILTFQVIFDTSFDASLANSSSAIFGIFATRFTNTISALGTQIGFNVIGTRNLVFVQGSVVATGDVTVTNVNDINILQQDIQNLINQATLSDLQNNNVTSVTITDFNECAASTDNDCGGNATCTSNTITPGFMCQCNAGFRDKNTTIPGRICEPQCELDGSAYCMNGGTCTPSLNSDTPTCACAPGFAGTRCETVVPETTTTTSSSTTTGESTTAESTTTESTTTESTTTQSTATESTTVESDTTQSTTESTTTESTTTESTTTQSTTTESTTTESTTTEPTTTQSTATESTTVESDTTQSTTESTTTESTTTQSTTTESTTTESTTTEPTTTQSTATESTTVESDTTQSTTESTTTESTTTQSTTTESTTSESTTTESTTTESTATESTTTEVPAESTAATEPTAATSVAVASTSEQSTTAEMTTSTTSSTAAVTSPEPVTTLTPELTTTPAPICPLNFEPVGGVCLASQLLVIEFTITGTFDNMLTDPSSQVYQEYVAIYILLMDALAADIRFVVIRYTQITFRSGSIVASGQTTLANVTNVDDTQQAIINVVQSGSNDVLVRNNVIGVTVTDVNECLTNNSDCDPNADCTSIANHPGYTCECRAGYIDLSGNGSLCESRCTPGGQPYCLNGGLCTPPLTAPPHCTCTQWYIGSRCETVNPSIVAAIVVGVVAGILLISVIVLIVCRFREKKSQGMDLIYSERSHTSRTSLEKYKLSPESDEESNVGFSNRGADFDAS